MKEITEWRDLSKIPILTHFEKDAGPYITSAVIHAKSVDASRPLSKPKEKFERAEIPVSKYVEGLRSVNVKILCTPIYILDLEK